jgi:hypothetical protein
MTAPAAVGLTRTAALAVARRARRYGYQADRNDPRAVSVACPQCREPVSAVREPRQASSGPLYESAARALDRAMVAHLTGGWCES